MCVLVSDRLYIMHMEYHTTVFNMARYPLAMLIKGVCGLNLWYTTKHLSCGYSLRIDRVPYYMIPSHSGLVFEQKERLYVVEFLGKGLHVVPLSEKKLEYRKRALIVLEELQEIPEELLTKLKTHVFEDSHGDKYTVIGAFLSFADGIFNRIRFKANGRTFCSAFVVKTLEAVGIKIENDNENPLEQDPVDLLYAKKTLNGRQLKSVLSV